MPKISDVEAAARRLAGVANRTPVLRSRTLDGLTGGRVHMKAENFQRSGAFKFRGAYNKLSSLAPGRPEAGVATYSSGNHAQAVALAAALVGTRAVIVMPEDAPDAKLRATRSYGAEIVTYDRYTTDRRRLCEALAAERGLEVVPPYDDALVVAGQGTVALELLEAAPALDVLVAPVGGGGLIAGCGIVAKHIRPALRLVGVEPEAGDDTARSLRAGRRVRIPVPRTIADGQQLDEPGELTFEINRRLVDDIVLVSDDDLVAAMAFAFDRLKIVLEPSGASGLAALLAGKVEVSGTTAGVVLSGGNVGLQRFCRLTGRVR